jgi:hypothetical protein
MGFVPLQGTFGKRSTPAERDPRCRFDRSRTGKRAPVRTRANDGKPPFAGPNRTWFGSGHCPTARKRSKCGAYPRGKPRGDANISSRSLGVLGSGPRALASTGRVPEPVESLPKFTCHQVVDTTGSESRCERIPVNWGSNGAPAVYPEPNLAKAALGLPPPRDRRRPSWGL